MSAAARKTISAISAHAGNASAYYSVAVGGDGLVPRVDGVEIYAKADWLTRGDLLVGTLSPKQARKLAVDLLVAADRIEERKS